MYNVYTLYMYMYVYVFCLTVCEWTLLLYTIMYITDCRTMGVGVTPLSCPIMFNLRVSNERAHDNDDGQELSQLIDVVHCL